jgi:hypothetical protein
MNNSESLDKRDIPVTFKGFGKSYEYPTLGALRKMAFESECNGLKEAFLKIGRRRLVLPETLFRLLKEKGSK